MNDRYQLIQALTDTEETTNRLANAAAVNDPKTYPAMQRLAVVVDEKFAVAIGLVHKLETEQNYNFEHLDPLNKETRVTEAVENLGRDGVAPRQVADAISRLRDGIQQIRWTLTPPQPPNQ